jgi:hypothetical protein
VPRGNAKQLLFQNKKDHRTRGGILFQQQKLKRRTSGESLKQVGETSSASHQLLLTKEPAFGVHCLHKINLKIKHTGWYL